MSRLSTPQRPAIDGRKASLGMSRARRDQAISLTIMVACLAVVFVLQPTLTRVREGVKDSTGKVVQQGIVPPPPDALRHLAAEFPRLTIGGFRGLLAPMLWQKAEDDKNERRWQDLDTTYNLIGKIQPYFVSVYIFNAWNQAYNLSAQWHNIADKYQWVLEGLAHLYEGEQYNPRNGDILYEIAQMYFMKIGNPFERITYREMWRDSIFHKNGIDEKRDNDPKLQEQHMRVRQFILRPQFHVELMSDPLNPAKTDYGIRINDFKHNKDTGKAEPLDCRFGVSPFYFAYIEYLRCGAVGGATTTGNNIVDAYPAMSLRMWCRDDSYFAQSKIREMFLETTDGQPAPADIAGFDERVLELRDCFRNVDIVAPMSADAFAKHLDRWPENRSVHTKHWLEVLFVQKIATAEHEMFEGLVSYYIGENNKHRILTPEARDHFARSIGLYNSAIDAVQDYMDRIYPAATNSGPTSDRADFAKYQAAMQQRIEGVRAILAAELNGRIDFSYLRPETIEK